MIACKNCDKQLEPAKFRMHELQCAKLTKRCDTCGQPVLKSEMDQHVLDEHTEKKLQTPEINVVIPQLPLQTKYAPAVVPIKPIEELKDFDEEEENQKLIAKLMQDDINGNSSHSAN